MFNSSTFASLSGRLVRYLMKSKEITIGRASSKHKVDLDLSLEGKIRMLCIMNGKKSVVF